MLANNSIGNLGRLGNQMFQYATLRGLASKHSYEYCLPPKDYVGTLDPNCKNTDTSIFDCFKIPEVPRLLLDVPVIQESCFELDEELWNNCSDNISLYGYFQTEKYFKHIDSTIREDFTFVDKIFHSCYYFLENTFGYSNCISLHIRRGDYLKYTHHPEQPMSYYETALTQFPELPVLVFSDDIEWCRQQELFKRERFYLSEGNGTAYDLCLQSLCQYHIIANSSFSWWGAWLADSQNVIAPRNWFGPPLSYNTKDLYLNHWTII
jgi:hypothetical protein